VLFVQSFEVVKSYDGGITSCMHSAINFLLYRESWSNWTNRSFWICWICRIHWSYWCFRCRGSYWIPGSGRSDWSHWISRHCWVSRRFWALWHFLFTLRNSTYLEYCSCVYSLHSLMNVERVLFPLATGNRCVRYCITADCSDVNNDNEG